MKRILAWVMAGTAALSFAGCARIQTKVVEKPRVDQEIQGNGGYLKGSGPAGGPHSSTRQMLETNIELPTGEELNPWRKHHNESAPAATRASRPQEPMEPAESTEPEESIPPIVESPESESVSVSAPEAAGTTYVVQKGDTLEKIAKKFYGSPKKWYRIYKANKGTLKAPDRIRPGQKLVIPPAEKEPEAGSHRSRHHEEYK